MSHKTTPFRRMSRSNPLLFALVLTGALLGPALVPVYGQEGAPFELIEASIEDIHSAIRTGQITCRGLVQDYIDRARAYNGVCTRLVTKDGARISPARGIVRAGAPLEFPTQTVPVSGVFPDFDQYAGPPFEFGRMEPTASDPGVQQQFGMRVGIPDAGQLNALETLNIRGERSVTCKGEFDKHPSAGSIPSEAPPFCEQFRRQPDALEQAAELDARYGANPPLDALPMYCLPFSFKNWYDSKDMRSTGGNDVSYAMDAPPVDSPDIADLRRKGGIVYAVASAQETGLTAPGPSRSETVFGSGVHAISTWSGQACNPYDTEREPRGTSSGSAAGVAANLVVFSICEQGVASCKGPASRNNVVALLTTKGLMMGGGMNSEGIGDRAGIHARTVKDAALVLDAAKGFDSRDMYSAIPKSLTPEEPFASFVVDEEDLRSNPRPLQGMRIAVVREWMVKHSPNDEAIVDQMDAEIKRVLRDQLGAELIESFDPLYPDDPSVPNMEYTFQDAFAEILAHNVPEYFQQTRNGELVFAVPGWDVNTVDYAIALALGKAPLSEDLNLRRIASGLDNAKSPFTVNKYLAERGDARVRDWASWFPNAKFRSDSTRAASENAIGIQNLVEHNLGGDERGEASMSYVKMHTVLRLMVLKVMYENGIDAFVNPENTLPPRKIGGPSDPSVKGRGANSCCGALTALLGGPEIDVPAGYVEVVYEPRFVLSEDKTRYREVAGTVRSSLPHPMPISMMFWTGPGEDATLIRIASAYEAATKHRVPPSDFGPVRDTR